MARAAVACARRTAPSGTAVELRELQFAAPFVVDGKTALHVALSASALHGDVDFDIYSGEADDACVHAQGTGRIVSAQAAGPLDTDAAMLRLREVPSSADHAPDAWRVWRGAGELLIAVDDQHLSPSAGTMISPTLANA
ncbi:hypothetical protein AB4084_29450, partial [Lysobacter sp. 2RAB21]